MPFWLSLEKRGALCQGVWTYQTGSRQQLLILRIRAEPRRNG